MADLEQLVLSISADTRQMQRALQKLTGDVKTAGDNIDSAFKAPKIDDVAKSINKTRFETANLAAQFQDIAVQLQGNQSPFTVALQQGTQISQVLGRQGAGGVVALLGTAFQSLLSPVSLVTIGVIALGGAALQYGAKAIGAVGDLDDKLKAHAELIKGLKDAYGEAGKGIDASVKESAAVLQAFLGLSTDGLQKQFTNLSNSVLASVTTYTTLGDAVGIMTEEASPKFAKFKGAIEDFRESTRKGAPDVTAFRAAIAQIAESTSDEKVKKLAEELREMTSKASEAQLAIEGTAKALRQLSPAALEIVEQGEKFKKAIDALSGTVSPDLTDRQKIMQNYSKALEQAAGTEERVAASRVKNDQLAVLSANDQKKASEEATKTAESNAKRFENTLQAVARSTAGNNGKISAEGLGVGALTRLETEARLTEAAQQSLGKVTDETAAKIKKQAEAAGQAADALARSKVNSQIDFGRQTAFLTPADVQIASQLRGIYGNDVPAALASSEAAALRLNNALMDISRTGQDITRGVFTDFGQQIRNGATAMDALKTAGTNALAKISDKLLSMAADNLWASAFGGSSGGLGSLLGLFGGGSGSTPSAVTGAFGPNAAITFANGGFTGSGGKYQPAGIVHKGEYVFDADATKRIGVDTLEKLRGYADGGMVGAPSLPNIPMSAANDNSSVSAPVAISIDARGADSAGLARVQAQIAKLQAELPMTIVATVQGARKRNVRV